MIEAIRARTSGFKKQTEREGVEPSMSLSFICSLLDCANDQFMIPRI